MSRETVIWQSYTWRIDSMKLVYKIIITMDGDLDEAHTGYGKTGLRSTAGVSEAWH
jgi:hypothetical protein